MIIIPGYKKGQELPITIYADGPVYVLRYDGRILISYAPNEEKAYQEMYKCLKSEFAMGTFETFEDFKKFPFSLIIPKH